MTRKEVEKIVKNVVQTNIKSNITTNTLNVANIDVDLMSVKALSCNLKISNKVKQSNQIQVDVIDEQNLDELYDTIIDDVKTEISDSDVKGDFSIEKMKDELTSEIFINNEAVTRVVAQALSSQVVDMKDVVLDPCGYSLFTDNIMDIKKKVPKAVRDLCDPLPDCEINNDTNVSIVVKIMSETLTDAVMKYIKDEPEPEPEPEPEAEKKDNKDLILIVSIALIILGIVMTLVLKGIFKLVGVSFLSVGGFLLL